MVRYALIAEPDPQRAAGLQSLIAEEGLECIVARDGAEAQAQVRQRGAPLLLVTDLALPRVDGFALLTWLREQEDAADTRVVVVTAFDELRVRAWQLKDSLGIHALLSRRASAQRMRDTLGRVLGGQRAPEPSPEESPSEQEEQRLANAAATRLMDDGPPEAELQQLVTEVAQAFGVPVALLTLVLGERQWFKAHVGLPPSLAKDRGTPRDWAFCHHVVQGREPLVVPDARRHPVFRDTPLVRDGVVGSYAGAPLRTSTGQVLGSLCVIDTRPLVLGSEDLAALRELASRVAEDLEQRARAKQAAAKSLAEPALTESSALALLGEAVQALDVAALLVAPGHRPYACNAALVELLGLPPAPFPGMGLDAFVQHVASLTSDSARTLRQLDLAASTPRGLHLTLTLERPQPRQLRWAVRPFSVPGGTAQMLTLTDLSHARTPPEEHQRQLRVDALTGLASRRAGEERVLHEIGRCRRGGIPFSVLLADLTGLGRLNATRGFDAGDAALRDGARVLGALGAPTGFAVRWDGGAFLLALPGTDAEMAEALRHRLHDTPGAPKMVSAAVTVRGEEDPQGTLTRAQAALARAKTEQRPPHLS